MYAIMKSSPCGVAEKIYCTPWEVTHLFRKLSIDMMLENVCFLIRVAGKRQQKAIASNDKIILLSCIACLNVV